MALWNKETHFPFRLLPIRIHDTVRCKAHLLPTLFQVEQVHPFNLLPSLTLVKEVAKEQFGFIILLC
jgi:hypothetical protein